MKKTAKAFTLVEMLIVIVIIGILIASLMPRMQSAQWRARDQIQTAIITSQADRGAWPGMVWNTGYAVDWTTTTTAGNNGLMVSQIAKNLQNAWMTAVPTDPNGSNDTYWLWSSLSTSFTATWQYIYMVWKRNWVNNAWFALMAKTEVEWSSNWVTCAGVTDKSNAKWYLTGWTDLAHVTLCSTVTQDATAANCKSNTWACVYTDTAELRYLLLY